MAKNGGKLFYDCTVCGNNRRSDRFPKGVDKTVCSSCLNRKSGAKSVINVSHPLTSAAVKSLPHK